jgi:hypothetical protein
MHVLNFIIHIQLSAQFKRIYKFGSIASICEGRTMLWVTWDNSPGMSENTCIIESYRDIWDYRKTTTWDKSNKTLKVQLFRGIFVCVCQIFKTRIDRNPSNFFRWIIQESWRKSCFESPRCAARILPNWKVGTPWISAFSWRVTHTWWRSAALLLYMMAQRTGRFELNRSTKKTWSAQSSQWIEKGLGRKNWFLTFQGVSNC